MKKLAIIGASYLQEPLIEKANQMGLETHVFAWAAGDVGEKSADYFYPISIIEKDEILKKCREIGIDGICSIASDLAAITVNYVASEMGLVGNSKECAEISTNKHLMRMAFEKNGDPSPKSILADSIEDLKGITLEYPVIVKPTDRSGSRGITKLSNAEGLADAIETAKKQGFEKKALVEEFAEGQEYSVECISFHGQHHFLAMTHKFTTGAPHFELKIDQNGNIKLIEIGGRMGGDCIGSDLVQLSTGVDFVKAVINVALGEKPDLSDYHRAGAAAIHYIFGKEDADILNKLRVEHPEYLVRTEGTEEGTDAIVDSSSRYGAFLMKASSYEDLKKYLPLPQEE